MCGACLWSDYTLYLQACRVDSEGSTGRAMMYFFALLSVAPFAAGRSAGATLLEYVESVTVADHLSDLSSYEKV